MNHALDLDTRCTPHEHTSASARRERRLLVKVRIRDDQMSQTLPDGRAYGPGEHTIQVYQSDLPNLVALHEDRPDLLKMARENCEARTAEFVIANRTMHADLDDAQAEVLSRREAPYNVPAEFRILIRTRDLLPVESYSIVGELESIAVAQARADDARIRSSQVSPAEMAAAMVGAMKDAGLVAAPAKGK